TAARPSLSPTMVRAAGERRGGVEVWRGGSMEDPGGPDPPYFHPSTLPLSASPPGTERGPAPVERVRLVSGGGRARFPRRGGAARPRRAYWQVETIEHETTHLLAPAWQVERDEELGGWIVTPGTVDVVIPAGD